MGNIWSRSKSFFGYKAGALPVLGQVGTPFIAETDVVYTVTGTTAITAFDSASPVFPGRPLVLLGTHATGPAFTDTAIASTANGKIHLSGALTLANGTSLSLIQANNGSWWETARSANG
jgi:hypothetical protein